MNSLKKESAADSKEAMLIMKLGKVTGMAEKALGQMRLGFKNEMTYEFNELVDEVDEALGLTLRSIVDRLEIKKPA